VVYNLTNVLEIVRGRPFQEFGKGFYLLILFRGLRQTLKLTVTQKQKKGLNGEEAQQSFSKRS
jgi:hypothetical protein